MVRLNGFDARTLEIQGLLATVRYRIKGKQVGKNSSVMLRAQRERDLALEASLEAELQQIRSERDDLAQRYIATK